MTWRLALGSMALFLAACEGSGPGGGSPSDADWSTAFVPDDPALTDTTTGTDPGDLETQTGCAGVYNPDQVLDFHLELDPADWQTLLTDSTYSIYVPGRFWCGTEAPVPVAFRRKRSGGTTKIGLKVDFNDPVLAVPGGRWKGLRKLTLENGIAEGEFEPAEVKSYVAEWLGWRIFGMGDTIAGRATFVTVEVNGDPLGVYLNLEQVDKEFLQDRLNEDQGWLYKKSGGPNDGWKTHEYDGLTDPYAAWFCFWGSGGGGCPVPPDNELLAELPNRLDIDQMLWFGATNAYLANTDAPLFKDNNYYFYDSDPRPRLYIPWDLDTTMRDVSYDVFLGSQQGPSGGGYDGVMLTHYRPEYEAILAEVVDRAPASAIQVELDRAAALTASAFAADPHATGTPADAASELGSWWVSREADVRGQLP